MYVAIALLLVGLGTVLFHLLSPWWFTPIASNWGLIDTTIIITFWVTGVVFIAVILFTAWCAYRYRYREGNRAEYEPENTKLEWQLTIFTTIGVVVMLTPGLWAWNDFVNVPEEAAEMEVVARQWDWRYRFPGKDGILGKTDFRLINDDNPFGVDPKDPNGQDDVLIDDPEVHLPLGQPVKVLLRSIDVLHDFMCPSSGPRWTWCQARSPISGSPRPGLARSTFYASNCAASATTTCAALSWSKKTVISRRG